MQVVRRTETPAGPLVKVIDAGSDQQPVTPAAVITIAANTPTRASVAQIHDPECGGHQCRWLARGRNTNGPLAVVRRRNGVDFARYAAGACPNCGDPATGGRPRLDRLGACPHRNAGDASECVDELGQRDADRDGIVPTGLSFSPIYQNAAQFNWTEPRNATDLIDVYVFQGSGAPSDWTPYFVCTLQPGSTSCLVQDLNGRTIQYQGRGLPSRSTLARSARC